MLRYVFFVRWQEIHNCSPSPVEIIIFYYRLYIQIRLFRNDSCLCVCFSWLPKYIQQQQQHQQYHSCTLHPHGFAIYNQLNAILTRGECLKLNRKYDPIVVSIFTCECG